MKLKLLNEAFSVCKVCDFSEVNLEDKFVFISKTDEELSLVCLTEAVPNCVAAVQALTAEGYEI